MCGKVNSVCMSRNPYGSVADSSSLPSSRGTSEEGSQLRRLGGMHDRQNLISRLQDEVRAWEQEVTMADDGR